VVCREYSPEGSRRQEWHLAHPLYKEGIHREDRRLQDRRQQVEQSPLIYQEEGRLQDRRQQVEQSPLIYQEEDNQ